MATYHFKVIICSGILYAFYLLFLEKEKMHVFNRFYLLSGLLASYFIPFITIKIQQPASTTGNVEVLPVSDLTGAAQTMVQQAGPTLFTFTNILWVTGVVISIYFLIRFVAGLIHIFLIIKRNKQTLLNNDAVLINIEKTLSPFSFGKYIFINEEERDERILLHELTHIRQKHWIDNVFMEIMIIFSWINPLVFLYKKSIKINHEFLADAAVIKHFSDVVNYRLLIVNKVFAQNNVSLASTFHFFTTKKRLLMLHKKTNFKQAIIRSVAILPVIGALIFFLSERVYAQNYNQEKGIAEQSTSTQISMDSASQDEIKIYDEITKKYGITKDSYKTKTGRFSTNNISKEDHDKLLNIYLRMNNAQKSMQLIHFTKATKPVDKIVPTESQMKEWKKPNLYGIWIDGKKVSNTILNNYKAKDFSHYFASKLYGAAKKDKQYDVQLNLMTNSYYEAYHKKTLENVDKYSMFLGLRKAWAEKVEAVSLTPAEMQEYKDLAKKAKMGENSYFLNEKDNKRATQLYNKMNKDQQKEVADLRIPPPPPLNKSTGISQSEMQEFKSIVKEITVIQNGRRMYKEIDGKSQRVTTLYNRMTDAQKNSVKNIFAPPPPPPPSKKK